MAYLEDNRGRSTETSVAVGQKRDLRASWFCWERWLPALILVFALIVWQCLVHVGILSPLFFPAPTVILRTLGQWLVSNKLYPHLGATLSLVFLGFAFGGLSGLGLGLAMGWSRRLRVMIDPIIAATHPIPKIAILPLLMIIFGIGEVSKFVLVAVVVFFPMLINTVAGVCQINPIYFEVARSYGASPGKIFTRVVIPGSLPMILAGMRLALNVSLLITIAVELVAAQRGLGALIWLAWQTLRIEELYASLTITAILGISFNFLLQRLADRIIPWDMGGRNG